MNEKIVKKEDLKSGDVLLLAPEAGSLDSKIICQLSNSPVSHSVMVYFDTDTVIEETSPYTTLSDLKQKTDGRKTYVMRHTDQTLDLTKVLDVAKKYYDAETPYAMDNIFPFALYLLGSNTITHHLTGLVQKLISQIFYIASSELVKIYDDMVYSDKHAMTCTQYVYRCFEEAGPQYHLKFKNHGIQNGLLKIVLNAQNKQNSSKENSVALLSASQLASVIKPDFTEDRKSVLHSLSNEITNLKDTNKNHTAIVKSSETMDVIPSLIESVVNFSSRFIEVYNKFIAKEAQITSIDDFFNQLSECEEYLLTPGDIYSNCENLEFIGILE